MNNVETAEMTHIPYKFSIYTKWIENRWRLGNVALYILVEVIISSQEIMYQSNHFHHCYTDKENDIPIGPQ